MTKLERLQNTLQGLPVDRLPFSFWHHFYSDCVSGDSAVRAHLTHLKKFDLDFLKIMNDQHYPLADGRLHLHEIDAFDFDILQGNEEGFGRQLDLIRKVRSDVGSLPIVATVINSWTALRRRLISPELNRRGVPVLGCGPATVDHQMRKLLHDNRGPFLEILKIITESQANFARECIEAGADGIYFSVRRDWVDWDRCDLIYQSVVHQQDRKILEAAVSGWFNILRRRHAIF